MLEEHEMTALVIEHRVRRGAEADYEKWLGEILEVTRKSPGYVGREIFPPAAAGEPYIVIVRFESSDDLKTWLESPQRKAAVAVMEHAFEDGDKTEVRAGIDVWFTPRGGRKPAAHKQFLLSAAAIYPLSLIVPRLLEPVFGVLPALKNQFAASAVVTLAIVGLMTYVVMPFLTVRLAGWLYESN